MPRSKIYFFIVIVILIIGIFFVLALKFINEDNWICVNGEWVKHGAPADPMPTAPCAKNQITDFASCASFGRPIMESYPRRCADDQGNVFVEDIGNELEKINLIRLDNPRPGATVGSPMAISGQARGNWFFEASFPIKLLDKNGQVLAETVAEATGDWMTNDFVNFHAELSFEALAGEKGTLILQRDNPSGLAENDDQLSVPLIFGQTEASYFKVYFVKNNTGETTDCAQVFAVNREVPKTVAVATAALTELLKGPNELERQAGYISLINDNVVVQKISIEQNVAKVDFNAELERGVGGSCWVTGIRAQIMETLKQFASVKEVIISIDGRTEDILQP